MGRRRLVAALVTAVMAAAPLTAAQPARAAQPAPRIVQIIAHPDDDLLFMSPDLSNSIKAHIPITTVYLSAGEADLGVDYAKQRQAAAMAAYSQMLGVTCPVSCWSHSETPVADHIVEQYAYGNIKLYFLNLHDGGTDGYKGLGALNRIWDGVNEPTLVMSDNGKWPQHYDRSGLTAVLAAIVAGAGPTLIRVQDPEPNTKLGGELGFPATFRGDNPDHFAAARFADDAITRYTSPLGGSPEEPSHRVLVEHYRDYNIQDTPANLSGAATSEKKATFEGSYGPHDSKLPRLPDGTFRTACNPDWRSDGYYQCWESRQHYRTPRSTQSVTDDKDHWLHAFAVESGNLLEWTEGPGGWSGPTVHTQAPAPLTAAVSVGHAQDGRIEVFGQRADNGDIVSSFQLPGGGWGWGTLGNPNSGPPFTEYDPRQVSAPVVASNQDGRLQLFVRNAGGGISSAWQTAQNGTWSGWADMGGSGVQEAPAAFTTQDGRIELFAWVPWNDSASVLHWYQPAANQPFTRGANLPIAPTSAPTVAMDRDGRLELLYRQIDAKDPMVQTTAKSYTMTLWQTSPGGGWASAAGALGNRPDDSGIGAPAAVTPGDRRIVVFSRNGGGGISMNRQDSENGVFGSAWVDLEGPGEPGSRQIVGVPAASVDRNGRATLLALGLDGRMYDNRQQSDGSFSKNNWKLMG
ncbi:PIG-L family deacetylase [Kitasatospora herbaricolor]|uniref:PIG-L family deacetylase n=1 Tax=Kitasatospora herbaricolor TaxID=68217 RepID=A0ABZ1WJ42_9ACTN|nr:PIG-L family deacetylase [Kitasatospora herbaricolor]